MRHKFCVVLKKMKVILSSKTKKILAISGGVVAAVVIFLIVYFTTKKKTTTPTPPSPMQLLQSRINDLVSGKTPINNLNVLITLTVQNNSPTDIFTLKLISNSDINGVAFGTFGTDAPANIIGTQKRLVASQIPTSLPTTYTLSSPVTLPGNQPDPTLESLQLQLNQITVGTTPLNNLKVTGTLTLISYGQDYSVNLVNKADGSATLGSCVMFANQDYINGYIGISDVYPGDKFDEYQINIASLSGNVPTCPATQPVPPTSAMCLSDIGFLNQRLDDIISGKTPITNLVVNGDLTVTGTSPTLFSIQKAYNCTFSCANPKTQDPTLLIGFNNQTDASGINADGIMWPFFGPADSVHHVSVGKNITT